MSDLTEQCRRDGDFVEGSRLFRAGRYREAYARMLVSAEHGNPLAQFTVGTMHIDCPDIERDPGKAFAWMERSAEQGYAEAQYQMGNFHYLGYGTDVSYTDAMSWYMKAAGQDHPQAQNQVGLMYHDGTGVGKDDEAAA